MEEYCIFLCVWKQKTHIYLKITQASLERNLVKIMDWEKKINTVKAGNRDTTLPQGALRLVPDRSAEERPTWVG